MSTQTTEDEIEGSWIPTIVIILIFTARWLLTSQGDLAVSLRRMMQMRKIETKKKLGLRDDSKYKMGVGDGASQKYKRQG